MKVPEIIEMVHQAQHLRSDVDSDVVENIRFLMGRFGSSTEFEDMDRVDVNMAWANMMAIIPTLYWRNPRVMAKGKRPQDLLKAPVLEAGIQHHLGKVGTQRTTQRLIVDAHCAPYSLAKLGYRVKDVEVAVKVNRKTGATVVVDESDEVDLSEFDVEQRTLAVGERPILQRVSFLSQWIDPLCADFDESPWLCQEITADVDRVIGNSNYKNTRKLQASGRVTDIFAANSQPGRMRPDIHTDQGPYSSGNGGIGKVRDNQVVLWEFWHKEERKLYVIVPDQGLTLREDDWPYPFFPYRAMQLGVPVPDTPYSIPPNSVWKAQQRELNKIRTYTLDHIKRNVTKILYDQAKLGGTQAEQDLREGTSQLVGVDGNPNEMAAALAASPVSADVWRCEENVKGDINDITGIAENRRASASAPGTTATEIRSIDNATGARIGYQRYQVSELVRWVAVGIHKLLRIYWDRKEWIQVTGRSDIEYRELDAEAIDGEFEIDIDVSSQLPPDKELEKKRALDNFSILAPIAVQRPDLLRFDELVRYLMERLEVPDPDRFLQTDDANRPPSRAEDERILLAQGGMPTFSPNDDHPGHILSHTEDAQNAKDEHERWRALMHLKKHLDYEEQRMLAQAMAASGMMQQVGGAMGQPGMGGPPPNVLPLQGGQGRQAPAPGYPMNPRLMSQDAPNPTTQNRVDSRRTG